MVRYLFAPDDGSDIRDGIERRIDDRQTLRRKALRVVTRRNAEQTEHAKATTLMLTVRDEAGRAPFKVRLVCQVGEI